ncbi:MAG: hypothetical protein KIS66_00210 [Fimbriimonadaceae bacterium]|nr:hypothetical protein [Fimbriimonadaceae bacterium]
MAALSKGVPRTSERSVTVLGVVAPPPIRVEGPRFSGSLATLFQCVRDRKIDLRGVPLAPVCEAYLDYLGTSSNWDLDGAATALEALSYLLERKAWILLPTPEAEPDLQEPVSLPEPTTDLFDEAIASLRQRRDLRERLFFRGPEPDQDPYEPASEARPVTVKDLARAFERLLAKAAPIEFEPPTERRRSLSEHMRLVLRALSREGCTLEDLVPQPFTRSEAVWWFLSLLELIRLDQASVRLRGEDVVFSRKERPAA